MKSPRPKSDADYIAQSPLFERKDWSPFGMRAATIAVAATLALNLTAQHDTKAEYVPVAAPTPTATETLSPEDAAYEKECEPISDESLQDLYADSWRPWVQQEQSYEQFVAENNQRRMETAQALDLTVFDYRTELQPLFDDRPNLRITPNESGVSMQEYYQRISDFLAKYNVEITFFSEEMHGDTGMPSIPYSYDTMIAENDRYTKQFLVDMAENIGQLPVEFIEELGMKRIVLMDINDGRSAGFVEPTDDAFDTVYLDPHSARGNDVVHEMVHLWDMRECGAWGFMWDEQYNGLNPDPVDGALTFYEDTDIWLSQWGGVQKLWDEDIMHDLTSSDPEIKRVAEMKRAAIDLVTVALNEYALTNTVEDKASLGAQLFTENGRSLVEVEQSPILQAKAVLLVARMYDDAPELVEYLAQTSIASRHDTNVLADDLDLALSE